MFTVDAVARSRRGAAAELFDAVNAVATRPELSVRRPLN